MQQSKQGDGEKVDIPTQSFSLGCVQLADDDGAKRDFPLIFYRR